MQEGEEKRERRWRLPRLTKFFMGFFGGGYTAPGTRDAPGGLVRFPVDFEERTAADGPRPAETPQNTAQKRGTNRLGRDHALNGRSMRRVGPNRRTPRARLHGSVAQERGEAPRYISPHSLHAPPTDLPPSPFGLQGRSRSAQLGRLTRIGTAALRRLESKPIRPHSRLDTIVTGLHGRGRAACFGHLGGHSGLLQGTVEHRPP